MQIADLRLPERLREDRLGMAALLPEVACSVFVAVANQDVSEQSGHTPIAVVGQSSSRVLSKRCQRGVKASRVELGIECNQMQVRRHDDKCVDAQGHLAMAEVEAFADLQARLLADEDGKPVDDGVG